MSPQHLNSQMVTTVATCTGSLRLASMNRVLFSLSLSLSFSLQFLTQKEFQQIKLEQLMATSSPAVGKKRTAEELLAAEDDNTHK